VTAQVWQVEVFFSSGHQRQEPQTYGTHRQAVRAADALCADRDITPTNVQITPVPVTTAAAA
jgi:hypothetical protein